jgi:hypothetical protein
MDPFGMLLIRTLHLFFNCPVNDLHASDIITQDKSSQLKFFPAKRNGTAGSKSEQEF